MLKSLKLLATPLCLLGFMGTIQIHAATLAQPLSVPATNLLAMPILPAIAESAALRKRCSECGVITSMREIGNDGMSSRIVGAVPDAIAGRDGKDTHLTRRLELTLQYRDGSQRVITDASPARWRLGEQVSVIDG